MDFNVGDVFNWLSDKGKLALTFVPKAIFDFAGHEDSVIDSATKIVREATENPLRSLTKEFLERLRGLIDNGISDRLLQVALDRSLDLIISVSPQINPVRLLEVALDRSLDLIISVSPQINPARLLLVALDRSLDLIISISHVIDSRILLEAATKLTRSILNAVIDNVGVLRIIREGILSNDVNAATLGLLWGNGGELARFFVDLVECMKRSAKANSWNGAYPNDDPQDNELDLTDAMNRHAAICQFQRLAKSVIFILKGMAVNATLDQIDMITETGLMSDVGVDSGTVINVPPSGFHPGDPSGPSAEQSHHPNEKWLFVNGIAGEYYWLYLACRKLARQYSRHITGVFNRGDGIFWDLVECAGERTDQGNGNASKQSEIVKRTDTSKAAQKILKDKLEEALKSEKVEHVVMIAHSQGCLLLRLVLQDLLTYSDDKFKTRMKNSLCIFTFGNPSLDWKARDPAATPLASHVLRTEHFANETDFVAKLGVLRAYRPPNSDPDIGYSDESVFVNKEWRGHLFGSQYSLNPNDYRNHQHSESWLLACGPRKSIRPV
ncbi:hypothetical protein ACKAV7_003803 [Fusarium commune]